MYVRKERRRVIRNRVEYWARQLGVRPRLVRVQHMTRKWGSCSTSGVVTFAVALAEQEPEFQDFVIAHELLHLRIPNHGKVFKALMTVHVPGWKKYTTGKWQSRVAQDVKRADRPPLYSFPPTRY